MDNRCMNRVATGAAVGGALGASIGVCPSNSHANLRNKVSEHRVFTYESEELNLKSESELNGSNPGEEGRWFNRLCIAADSWRTKSW